MTGNYDNVPRRQFHRDQYNCFITANMFALMKNKTDRQAVQHTKPRQYILRQFISYVCRSSA